MQSDLDLIEELAQIDASKLTTKQVMSLGLSLSILSDMNERRKVKASAFRTAIAIALSSTISATVLLITTNMRGALLGVICGLFVCAGIEAYHFWNAHSDAAEVFAGLQADIKQLSEQQEQ